MGSWGYSTCLSGWLSRWAASQPVLPDHEHGGAAFSYGGDVEAVTDDSTFLTKSPRPRLKMTTSGNHVVNEVSIGYLDSPSTSKFRLSSPWTLMPCGIRTDSLQHELERRDLAKLPRLPSRMQLALHPNVRAVFHMSLIGLLVLLRIERCAGTNLLASWQ